MILLMLLVIMPMMAGATNGYFSHGYGTASKGLAGAGAALSLDTLSAASNPATMFYVGERMDIGLALFNPGRGYEADPNGPAIPAGKYDSDNNAFLVPSFGRNWVLDTDNTLGLSIGGNGGMNTSYSSNPFKNFGAATRPAGIDMSQLFAGITWAHRLSDQHVIGVTPVLVLQSLKVEGLEPFTGLSLHPGHVTNRGRDWSAGTALRLGWLGKLNDQISLGISYQSRGYMSRFEQYKGLLAESGDFDLPPQINMGLAWELSNEVTAVIDFQRINYGDIKSLANSNNRLFWPPNNLGGDNGLGFGWQDVKILKLGASWRYDDKLTLRAGYSHASDAITGEEGLFNILAPAVVRDHVSVGASWQYDRQSAVHLAFTRGISRSVNGTNPNVAPQTGSLNLSVNELEISGSRTF